MLIVASATVSLLLIGLLAITMTPDRSPAPIAASSTVIGAAATPAAIVSTTATTATTTSAAVTQTALPVVTPIGNEGWAVTTWDAVEGETGWMKARLPSGAEVEIEVIGTDRATGLVVVTLPVSADADGYQLAAQPPRPSDTVLVRAAQPKVVPLIDLAYLDVEEATPVLDSAGELVGLCTESYHGTTLMPVDTMPDDTTGDPGVGSTTAVETSAPETTTDATTVESTTPESSESAKTVVESTTVVTTTPDTAESTTPDTTDDSNNFVYPPGR